MTAQMSLCMKKWLPVKASGSVSQRANPEVRVERMGAVVRTAARTPPVSRRVKVGASQKQKTKQQPRGVQKPKGKGKPFKKYSGISPKLIFPITSQKEKII